MQEFAQQVVNGLTIGIIYGLVATGFTLIVGVVRMLSFTHGVFYTIGGMSAAFLVKPLGLNYFIAIPLGIMITVLVGWICEKLVMRRLREVDVLTAIIATFGLALFIQEAMVIMAGPVNRNIVTSLGPRASVTFLGITTTQQRLFAALIGILIVVFLTLFIKSTKTGKAMRATAQNRQGAALVGIDVNRIYTLTFAVGCGLAGAAGILLTPVFQVSPYSGWWALFKAFIVVILGGTASVPGAILGGLILGVVESVGAGYVSSALSDVFGFLVVIIILLARPSGLLGRPQS